jgi:hypothetical protein
VNDQVWYFVRDNELWGPVSAAELLEMVRYGELSAEVMVETRS